MVSQVVKMAETIAKYLSFRNQLLGMGFMEKGGAIKNFDIAADDMLDGVKVVPGVSMVLGYDSNKGVIVDVECASGGVLMVSCYNLSTRKIERHDLGALKIAGRDDSLYIPKLFKKHKFLDRPIEVGDTLLSTYPYNHGYRFTALHVDEGGLIHAIDTAGNFQTFGNEGIILIDAPKKEVVLTTLFADFHQKKVFQGIDIESRSHTWREYTEDAKSLPVDKNYARIILPATIVIKARSAKKPDLDKVKRQTKKDMTEERRNKAKTGSKA